MAYLSVFEDPLALWIGRCEGASGLFGVGAFLHESTLCYSQFDYNGALVSACNH